MIRHKAYLVLKLKQDGTGLPKPHSLSIFSSHPMGLTTGKGEVYAEIMHIEADSYHEAAQQLREFVLTAPGWEWAKVWVDDSKEAHMARGELLGYFPGTALYQQYMTQHMEVGQKVIVPKEAGV